MVFNSSDIKLPDNGNNLFEFRSKPDDEIITQLKEKEQKYYVLSWDAMKYFMQDVV